MRIAVATEEGYVAQHFGRCPGFTIVDVEDGQVVSQSFVENPGYKAHQPGLVPNFLKSQGVNYVIAGGMGPNAIMMLESFGIRVVLGIIGRVEEVIEAFLKGNLRGGESLCEHGDHECRH
ncbi:dinitrogenase iron-molybdenum cofactor [Thermodesulfobacterium sp. TA1]|uniref:NifB/NifX family molybdenum-iron cluster-binding protein n=1 Tax=Thermodesulfobacterium sp. TA1 TaxID=2234087 RepID=UPI0012327DAC|nr:NifB/NifX family molybdenum-iron cluster-binding protein [Thermodesulfobacterium sp. TA1]QER41639.1 dinitrogenase iron-molybdenum cofactor [Thermodesulfobacterium sp. TA1]